MRLEPGTRIGVFEILSLLGVGGMGEVYRARDTKLGREVAIKILPEALAGDRERRARFEREAKLLAALNHPGIATLHGVDEDSGRLHLVMELVEGETLSERIARGRLDWEEAKELFVPIAQALEAAHAKGVLHRDLKPSNVKITPEGRVKLLDFGLAKALQEEGPVAEASRSPTLTKGTALGAILGTASYMSPEQARGKPVDRRTDIWAFGCCLYEGLTGERAFSGETVTDVLAAVMKNEPDFSRLPRGMPAGVERALRRSLTKDPARRLHDVADLCLELEEAVDEVSPPMSRGWSSSHIALVALSAGIAALAVSTLSRRAPPPEPRRFEITFPPEESPEQQRPLAISRDGRRIAYASAGERAQLFVRELGRLESRALSGTEGARMPVFSPDGKEIAFHDGRSPGRIRRIGIDGGAPIDVAPARYTWWAGMDWGREDTLVFSEGPRGLSRVLLGGGEPENLTVVVADSGELMHVEPRFLPRYDELLFTVVLSNNEVRSEVLNLTTKERTVLEGVGPFARFVETGHLLYPRAGSILVTPFDLAARKTLGREVPLGFSAESRPEAWREEPPYLEWSDEGTLLYVPPGGLTSRESSLAWVEPDGRRQTLQSGGTWSDPWPRISPDGEQVAFTSENVEIWIRNLERDAPPRRLTFEGMEVLPVWSPDGKRLAFIRFTAGGPNVVTLASDGSESEPRLVATFRQAEISDLPYPSCWTPNGDVLAFDSESIWVMRADGSSEPKRLFETTFQEGSPAISPDGSLLAYTSTRSGGVEVFLSPYPDVASKPPLQVSRNGGAEPRWSRNGRELYFREGRTLHAVNVERSGDVRVGPAKSLFELKSLLPYQASSVYDVAPDGRFLVVEYEGQSERSRAVLVENWFEELKRLTPR
jgi:serine/threonine protein kinase